MTGCQYRSRGMRPAGPGPADAATSTAHYLHDTRAKTATGRPLEKWDDEVVPTEQVKRGER